MNRIATNCSLLLVLVLCGRVICTSYIVLWTESYLTTLSNSLDVYVGDEVYFDCSATNTSDVLYVNSKESFDSCNTEVGGGGVVSFLLLGCADSNLVPEIVVLNNTLVIPFVPVSVPGSSLYLIGSNADDCENGLKLALNININKNPNSDSDSITITPTAPPPTTAAVVSSSSSTTSGGMNVQVSSVSSVSSGGATPTADGTGEGSVRFFVDWSLGARVGLIVGCAVALAAALIVCCVCFVFCYKCLSKRETKDMIGIESIDAHSMSLDNDMYNKLDSENSSTFTTTTVDSNKSNYKEEVDAPVKITKSINHDTGKTINSIKNNKNNGVSSTKSARPPPKNSIRPAPGPPPTAMTSLPARGSNNPPRNLPPLASLPVESPRRKAPPPPKK